MLIAARPRDTISGRYRLLWISIARPQHASALHVKYLVCQLSIAIVQGLQVVARRLSEQSFPRRLMMVAASGLTMGRDFRMPDVHSIIRTPIV